MEIIIDKQSVRKVANQMNEYANDFSKEIEKLSNIIDNINIAWKGDDALKYINLLKTKYFEDLTETKKQIKKYSKYLENIPEAYDALEDTYTNKSINI